jgi:putative two-component system response regulator
MRCTDTLRRVLVVDDEPQIHDLLVHWLTGAGYACDVAKDAETALNALRGGSYTLLITDIAMPGRSGMELLTVVREELPHLAVIMVTAVDDREMAIEALTLGAYGYIIKPFDKNEILINVAGALERRRLMLIAREHERDLEDQVRARTVELREREEAITFHLLSAAELRDDETGAHVRRIGLYSATLAKRLGWDPLAADDLRLAAPMHDIGKIGIPDTILRKPGPLTPDELAIMRTHAAIGARVLDNANVELLRLAAETARSHHERWDGGGYPEGLAGSAIPRTGRLVAIVDVFDALTHDRAYRPALSEDEALALMRAERGGHFDPEMLDCFMDCLPELRAIRDQVPETRGR